MWQSLVFCLSDIVLVSSAFEFDQNQYKIIPENYTLDFIDHKLMDSSFGVVKINKTNAIRGTFKYKINLPEDARIFVKGFKWFNDEYSLPVLQFDKTMKDLLDMELFDFQTIFVHHARPPITWPIEKNVTYRIAGWIPDSTKFPPNLPEGKWMVGMSQALANKTRIIAETWYLNIKYNK